MSVANNSESELIEYDSACYEVQCIRNKKLIGGKMHYEIKWQGWDDKDNTWEPIQNLQIVLPMVDEFNKNYENKKQSANSKKQSTPSVTTKLSIEQPKKTKQIEKQKEKTNIKQKKKIAESSENESRSFSSSSDKSAKSTKQKKHKTDQKKQQKKITISQRPAPQKLKQKEKEKTKEREKVQKQRMKQTSKQGLLKESTKQKIPQTTVSKKSQSIQNQVQKNSQANSSAAINSNKMIPETSEMSQIEITRINHHIVPPPESLYMTSKLYYNVDRRMRISKKPLPVVDVPSEEISRNCPLLLIKYLEDFAKEVEFEKKQKDEYENKRNVGNLGLGVISHKVSVNLKK